MVPSKYNKCLNDNPKQILTLRQELLLEVQKARVKNKSLSLFFPRNQSVFKNEFGSTTIVIIVPMGPLKEIWSIFETFVISIIIQIESDLKQQTKPIETKQTSMQSYHPQSRWAQSVVTAWQLASDKKKIH